MEVLIPEQRDQLSRQLGPCSQPGERGSPDWRLPSSEYPMKGLMADPEHDDLRSEEAVRAEAKKVPPDVARFIREGPKRPRGRPKGSGAIDDSARVLEMAVLL